MADLEDELLSVLEALDATVWKDRGIDLQTIEAWLADFGADCERGTQGRLQALYLLSRFTYFGDDEIRALATALYRDCFQYPAIAAIRRANGNTRDPNVLAVGFDEVLNQTRFLGMGNPSESGTHLLYHYRQENSLNNRLFISPHEMFDLTVDTPTLADSDIKRYIFIDDFCGSGIQAVRYSRKLLDRVRKAAIAAGVTPILAYHVLVATKEGLQDVRAKTTFDQVTCVIELDETFKAFAETSRYFLDPPEGIIKETARGLALRHGNGLFPEGPLGFGEGQLMLAFSHNTPNNTLPIFWHSGTSGKLWSPVFRRYGKTAARLRRKQT